MKIIRFMLHIFFRIFHALQFHGAENIPLKGPAIIAGNHPSFFDPVVVQLGTDRWVRFFALADLLDVPIVGWLIRKAGILPVVRGGDNEASVQKALRILRRGGVVGIFPEGRLSHRYTMGEPKPGVGRLAVQSGAPVVPCVIYGTWKAWPYRTALPHPAKIVVDFLPPLRPEGADTREDHERLARRVREAIVAEQLKHRLGPAPSGVEVPDY